MAQSVGTGLWEGIMNFFPWYGMQVRNSPEAEKEYCEMGRA